MSAVCRDCALPITWVTTIHGKKMPLNARPTPNGSVLVDMRGRAQRLRGRELQTQRQLGQTLYIPHFSTCPKAATGRLDVGAA